MDTLSLRVSVRKTINFQKVYLGRSGDQGVVAAVKATLQASAYPSHTEFVVLRLHRVGVGRPFFCWRWLAAHRC